jgi:hypothetical protein
MSKQALMETVQVDETTLQKKTGNTLTSDHSMRTDSSMDDFDDGIDRDRMSSLEVNKNFNCRRSVQMGFGIERPGIQSKKRKPFVKEDVELTRQEAIRQGLTLQTDQNAFIPKKSYPQF